MSANKASVAQIPAFRQLDCALQDQIAASAQPTEFQSGQIIFSQNDTLTGLYGLLAGHVKLYRTSAKRVQILALLREGDCFGIETLSRGGTSSYSAATVTPVELFFVPEADIYRLIDDNAAFREIVIHLVTSRLRQFASLVHNLAFRDVTARLATVIIKRAEEDGELQGTQIHLPRLLTQRELATMVGTGREVVQRTFKKFEEQGVIQFSRSEIVILDMEALHQIASEESR